MERSIHESQFSSMISAQEKMQVGILAGIPGFPPMLPVGSFAVTAIFTEDFYRPHFARSGLRVENKLRTAIRLDRSVLRGWIVRLF